MAPCFFCCVLLALVATSGLAAHAATVECVAGGSAAAPLDYRDPATWSPPGVPDTTTDVRLAASCQVRCNAGTCDAHSLKGTHPAASLEIAPGASLVLSGCEDADATDPAGYECGGENGFRFAPQGAVLYDSTLDGEVALRGVAQPAHPDRLRLLLVAPIDVAIGDWFQVRGGPARGHVYRVLDADVSGCSSNPDRCYFEVALHDPDMEFGRNSQTAGFATGIGYVGGAAAVRVAAAGTQSAAGLDLSRCVELCSGRVGNDCIAAGTITRDHSYVGWSFGITDASMHPADPAAMERRLLVVETQNDVAESIGPGQGQVDRVCFAEAIPKAWLPAADYDDTAGVFWPGFWPGDAWLLFRPATVRSIGAQRDAGLGFHAACVDSDFAYFDGWAKLSNRGGTPACQDPYQDTVIVASARGLPQFPFDQQAPCNGHSLDIWNFDAFRGDRVAIVDSRTPVDTSATCNTGAQPWDGDPTSGYHGVSLSQTRFDSNDPPARWLIRYAGDDGVIMASDQLGPASWTFRGWSWWCNAHGGSTSAFDTENTAPGQSVRFEDARVTMFASGDGCLGSFDDATHQVRYEVDGMLYVDPQHDGPLIDEGASGGHDVRNLLAFSNTTSCAAMRSGSVHDSWIEGWNRLIDYEVHDIDGVYFAAVGGANYGSVFGVPASGTAASIRDFVATNLPATSLLGSVCGSGCDLSLRDGFAAWAQPNPLGVSNFYSTANLNLAIPLEGMLFSKSNLLRCSAGWGESGTQIGRNLLVDAPQGIAIQEPESCPLAAPQELRSSTELPTSLPYRVALGGDHFGPRLRVGLSATQTMSAGAGLVAAFALPAAACTNGIDDDGDGFIDYPADPGCPNAFSAREDPECSNGIDDDGDSQIDLLDPECNGSAGKGSESSAACGLGFEIVLVLPLLARWRRAALGRIR